MDYRIEDLLDIPKLQLLLDELYKSSKIPSAIIDNDGRIHTGSGWQDACTKFHRLHPEVEKLCIESDKTITRQIRDAKPTIVYRCPQGLVDTATPLIVEGRHLANVFTGQLFLEAPDLEAFRRQARRYGWDEEAYLDAIRRVPVIAESALRDHLSFLARFTEMLAEAGLKRLREKEAEARLRESEERYRTLFEQTGDYVLILEERKGGIPVIADANDAALAAHGYSREELMGQPISLLDPDLSPGIVADRTARIGAVGKPVLLPVRHRRKDGSHFEVEVLARSVRLGGKAVIFSVERDVTERKRMEEEKARLQAQLQQAMKMEAVGRLAGGVAHDFNNLLTAIIGNVLLAREKIPPSHAASEMLAEAHDAARRAARLTRQLLAFSRKQIIEPRVVDIDDLVAGLESMLARLVGENIVTRILPGGGLRRVRIDPGQFEQIVVNLAVNARDAMPDGGILTIETANADRRDPAGGLGAPPGRLVVLAVSDTGHGMSEEVKAHLFEPFFTTKPKGSGTGLGLATIYGAVEQAGGSIEVRSGPGEGATFRIFLPAVDEEAAPRAADDARPEEIRGGAETLLLVEDEEAVRNLCVRILGELGYRVVEAADGGQARALAGRPGERIDLLVTDVVMPGGNGKELAEALAPVHPGMKVLFMSGYTDDVIGKHGVMEEGVSFIAKPFAPETLAKRIRAVLDGA